MPKITIDEYGNLVSGENDIRAAGKTSDVFAKAKAGTVQRATH
jgi:hypothetical protein